MVATAFVDCKWGSRRGDGEQLREEQNAPRSNFSEGRDSG